MYDNENEGFEIEEEYGEEQFQDDLLGILAGWYSPDDTALDPAGSVIRTYAQERGHDLQQGPDGQVRKRNRVPNHHRTEPIKERRNTMNKLKLYTANRMPESLTNLTYSGRFTVTDMIDATEDSANGAQLVNRLRGLGLTDRMEVAWETDTYTRIRITDYWGNEHYLDAKKD